MYDYEKFIYLVREGKIEEVGLLLEKYPQLAMTRRKKSQVPIILDVIDVKIYALLYSYYPAEDRKDLHLLHQAVSQGKFDIVRFLVGQGMDVNEKAYMGKGFLTQYNYETVLHALSSEHKEDEKILRFLLDQGADPTLMDDWELTILHGKRNLKLYRDVLGWDLFSQIVKKSKKGYSILDYVVYKPNVIKHYYDVLGKELFLELARESHVFLYYMAIHKEIPHEIRKWFYEIEISERELPISEIQSISLDENLFRPVLHPTIDELYDCKFGTITHIRYDPIPQIVRVYHTDDLNIRTLQILHDENQLVLFKNQGDIMEFRSIDDFYKIKVESNQFIQETYKDPINETSLIGKALHDFLEQKVLEGVYNVSLPRDENPGFCEWLFSPDLQRVAVNNDYDFYDFDRADHQDFPTFLHYDNNFPESYVHILSLSGSSLSNSNLQLINKRNYIFYKCKDRHRVIAYQFTPDSNGLVLLEYSYISGDFVCKCIHGTPDELWSVHLDCTIRDTQLNEVKIYVGVDEVLCLVLNQAIILDLYTGEIKRTSRLRGKQVWAIAPHRSIPNMIRVATEQAVELIEIK